LRTWGDGRRVILGTKGYIELRKYIDIASEPQADNQLLLVNDSGEERFNLTGKVGLSVLRTAILDCLRASDDSDTRLQSSRALSDCTGTRRPPDRASR
jgi:hypothetical protein